MHALSSSELQQVFKSQKPYNPSLSESNEQNTYVAASFVNEFNILKEALQAEKSDPEIAAVVW